MDKKTLDLLEFRKVQEMLAAEADTPLGRERAREAGPVTVPEAVTLQKPGRELMEVLSKTASPGLHGATDIRVKVLAAGQGIVLSGIDLHHIHMTISAMDSLSRWLTPLASGYPSLSAIRERLPSLPALNSRLSQTVDYDGTIKDGASPALRAIRRSLADFQDRIRRRAEELVRRRDIAPYLQESIVSLRDGRYVFPVRQEHAAKVTGLVHDQSSSGMTVFVEPQELLEMGNRLRRLQLSERDEVDRILEEVSSLVGESSGTIAKGSEALAEFDFAQAKARLAFRWRGGFPTLAEKPLLRLVDAWHPLLKGTPVPMDIDLREDGIRTAIVTGPNMGGKTVALKTTGLLTAMALSGFPCPSSSRTTVGQIDGILCDIGDEQSIEEELSTFSAHITNVTRILGEAGPGKLVLIDELGSSTDPREGAALASAIVRRLNDSGALSVVTSHFSELKAMAQETYGMTNASVEWDPVNMVPTYRLVMGRPGRSNAFFVAERLGLPPDVLAEARASMDPSLLKLDEVIEDMERASEVARREAEAATRDRQMAAELLSQQEKENKLLESRRKEMLLAAKKEASALITRAKVELERAAREFRDWDKKSRTTYSAQVSDMRERLRQVRDELGPDEEEDAQGTPMSASEALPGVTAMVAGFGEPGVILLPPDSDHTVVVRIGSFSMRVRLLDLRHPPAENRTAKDRRRSAASQSRDQDAEPLLAAKATSAEIDLRGMNGEEARIALDKYLDDALLAGLSQVRIIHGKGTGALRVAVTEYLGTHPRVSSLRLGEAGEGGLGVTVASLG